MPAGLGSLSQNQYETSKHIAQEFLDERTRQVKDENWSSVHDDAHSAGELARAAAVYAMAAWKLSVIDYWPWSTSWLKLSNHRRNLVKAGALIVAEIERIDRETERRKS
jgi:hypothetical protein